MSYYALVKQSIEVIKVTSSTKLFPKEGREDILAMHQITSIGVMVCPPYTFVVSTFHGKSFIIEIHVIASQLGGNSNGIVIVFLKIKYFTQWLFRRLETSGVKMDTMDVVHQISFVKSGLTSRRAEDESCVRTKREQDVTTNTVMSIFQHWKISCLKRIVDRI